ncbi:MAG: hypothetical protein ACFFE4_17725 [Candidatus Thorarchaeota archaeon]
MKRINTKSLMVFTILFASIVSMPMVVNGQQEISENYIDFNQIDAGIFQGFQGGFGALFGQNLGYGGRILESIFRMLFLQGLNLTSHEMLDNVFVLSANHTTHETGVYDFTAENDEFEIYFAPHEYNDLIPAMTGGVIAPGDQGHAYCVVKKEGVFTYDLEIGAAVTLIIWDNDRSFITAVNKLINFFKRVMVQAETLGEGLNQDLIREGVSLLTWFLIHINDIFTGDELFIMNPITWQKLDIMPGPGFNITKTWFVTGNTPGDMNINPLLDPQISDLPNGTDVLAGWMAIAQSRKDNYMEWLLTPTLGNIAETIWTQFSFDLIQLWIKNFEIHIDVGQILGAVTGTGGGDPGNAIVNAFEGCNIEFFLFTHHLAGAFLYNDTDSNDVISANYTPIIVDGTSVEVPSSTELTHRLILGTVNSFSFNKPTINPSNKSISWGLNIWDANITAVPLGVDLNSYIDAPEENLDYIYFGFTFEPTTDRALGAAHGLIKLDQFFAPWNDLESPHANSPISGLDLAIIYVSTVLHFELDIATQGQLPETPLELLSISNYKSTEKKLTVGNYIGARAQNELEFIDIAGIDYEYGSNSARLTAPASTSIIPRFVWELEQERHDTVVTEGGGEVSTFSSDIRVQTEFNVLVWAVCYPEFEDGTGIWHDPTFSVYMVFQSEGFWALIVLIAGVGLVGVATVLIKRRKDRRF